MSFKLSLSTLVTLVILFSVGCGTQTQTPQPSQTPQPTQTPRPTQTTEIECMVQVTCHGKGIDAGAWIDENENGTWDLGEFPLAGIKFHAKGDAINDDDKSLIIIERVVVINKEGTEVIEEHEKEMNTTDNTGWVEINLIWVGGCETAPGSSCTNGWAERYPTIVVKPEIPSGYRLTTESSISVASGKPRIFGFVPLTPMATPTAQNE